jgi:Spy/CpxP family protein refolding chaperone
VRLPADLRADLRDALREDARRLMPPLREVVQARRAMVAAMTATPPDRAATDAAMTAFRQSLDRLLAEVQPVLLDRLEARAAP